MRPKNRQINEMVIKQRKIPILHLNNPLEHLGLEPQTIFLKKQKEAIKNLYKLQPI